MKNYSVADHVNYTHFVGQVIGCSYTKREGQSNYFQFDLGVQTKFRGKLHPQINVNFICWDHLADSMQEYGIKRGDLLNVEGRLTIRNSDGRPAFSITANKVHVVKNGKLINLHEEEE